MEFVEEDGEIVIHLEEFDTDRAIITDPVTWETYWAWEPAQELKAYECTLGG